MKFKYALIFLLAVVALAWFTYRQIAQPFKKFEQTPDFSLPSFNYQKISLSAIKGSPILIHFWATWCPQCVEEISSLDKFAKEHPDIKVLAISEDEGGEQVVRQFFGNNLPSFTILFDEKGQVSEQYKNYKIPETYLLNADGKFVERFSGAIFWGDPKIYELIKNKL